MIGFFTTLLLGAYMTIMATPEPSPCSKAQVECIQKLTAEITQTVETIPSWLRVIHEPALDATMQISTVLHRFHS